MSTQRDIFIEKLFEYAKKDKNVYLISVDMGAPSLDKWRLELPNQFISAGISEQNAINIAAGMANSGKKVYVYFMASWVARCFEQIRYSCSMANNPITILGNGVGLGYAPAGPAHEPTEDIAYMRSLNNIEIYSPSNLDNTNKLVNLTYENPKLRYIRLERTHSKEMDDIKYKSNNFFEDIEIKSNHVVEKKINVLLISYGFMMGRALKVASKISDNYKVDLFDLWRIKPLDKKTLVEKLKDYDYIVTIEEQSLDGGFGSAICEIICDYMIDVKVIRFGLPSKYIFENGTREELLNNHGLSVEDIVKKINKSIYEKKYIQGD